MTEGRPTILVVVSHGFAARCLLRTEVLSRLALDADVVVLTPSSGEAYFRQEFGTEVAGIEHLEVESSDRCYRRSLAQRLLRHVRTYVLDGSGDLTTVDDLYTVHRQERRTDGLLRKGYNLVFDTLVWGLRRSRRLRRLLIRLESTLFNPGLHSALFEKYRPALLVVTSLGYFRHEDYLMREARSRGVPIASVILSWDNTTSWGMAGADPSYVVAQTSTMKEELVTLHNIDPGKVFVEGVPHFDHYFRADAVPERVPFLGGMGLDPGKRLILLATQSPNIFPWNGDLVALLANAIERGEVPRDCQLVARLHPLHLRVGADGRPRYAALLDEYAALKRRYPFVVFNVPRKLSGVLEADMPRSEMRDVAGLLRHADVLVNHYSTIAVEACIFDLPTINLGFEPGDLSRRTRLKQSCELAERRTHNQRVIRAGGVRTVYDEASLFAAVNAYLSDRSLDQEGRRRVMANECGPNLGEAGRRVGERLLSLVAHAGAR